MTEPTPAPDIHDDVNMPAINPDVTFTFTPGDTVIDGDSGDGDSSAAPVQTAGNE